MYLRQLSISNIRSLESFAIDIPAEDCAGWHVVLGANGAGKSTVIRSLALALAGPKEAAALRQNWTNWLRTGAEFGSISLKVDPSSDDIFEVRGKRAHAIEAKLEFRPAEGDIGPKVEMKKTSERGATRSIWGANSGWFSASFGPFRRFTGGDRSYERLFYSNPRLAPHLSAFGEDVALTEGLRWLTDLRVAELEGRPEGRLLKSIKDLLNGSGLLPDNARISDVTSEKVSIVDADDFEVSVEQMSDGYRSVLSMIFEIMRQMTKAFGVDAVVSAIDVGEGTIGLPGVVAIDEVDAHLHPSWQVDIGPWFSKCFPNLQFIVTTHSPIICRNAKSVWRLASPGSGDESGQVKGVALKRLIYGSILEAYGTEYFGQDVVRSSESSDLMDELARLNLRALRGELSGEEERRMADLRATLPTEASSLAGGG